MIGKTLAHYEIIAPLGAGGMGEVFLATDTRLGREVAIKVLPQHLSANPEVRARFEREARTISSLNHPHICTLHDVGRVDDTDYLVMELVEGETLAQRLEKGALPTDEVLELGRQIADALEQAHRAGVVHRDLKPGNVMLTKSGAKLMDFGLARAIGMAGPAAGSGVTVAGLAQSPTVAQPLTAEGTIVGTFQYMAPEQLEGSEADARSDLGALGCVLYEMAPGRRAIEGKSQASLISSIMGSQPTPISQMAPMTPPGLDRAVKQCLAKDPDDRWQTAGDLRRELGWLAEGGSQAGVPAPVATRRRGRARLSMMLAAAGWLAAVVIAVFAWNALRSDQQDAAFFATVEASPSTDFAGLGSGGPIALSPDGSRLAAVVVENGESMISIYDFGSGDRTVLESTKGAMYPFWSPDSRWIGFFADGKLRKVEARGGPAQPLADAFNGRGGSWSPDGVIIFAPDIFGPLMQISENGGAPTAITEPTSEEVTHRNPYFLSDGRRFLFTERGINSDTAGRLMVSSIDSEAAHEMLGQASGARISQGFLLFVRDYNLLAQRFDEKTLALSGPIVPIAENLQYWNPKDVGNFSTSPTGLLVYRQRREVERSLMWFDRDGRLIETLTPKEVSTVAAKPSRDLRQIGLISRESSSQTLDIWLLDTKTKQRRRATFTNAGSLLGCAFSVDAQRLAVSNWDPGNAAKVGATERTLWIQPISGSSDHESVLENMGFFLMDWSPDGNVLLGWSQRAGTSLDITFVRLDDPEHPVHNLINTRFNERSAQFSPDAAWVVYQSDESGRNEIYVVDFPDASRKWQVSRDGGTNPIWSQDGREIFFGSPGSLMAAPVARVGDGIEIGTPVKVGLTSDADITVLGADRERLLVLQTDRPNDSG
ncbi:MAG: protein kinase, partial [Gemmatimonadota bacterium]